LFLIPIWDAGNEAEERANNLAKNVKELTEKIKILENSILDFSPPKKVTKVKQQIQKIKDEVKQFQTEEQNQREFAKEQKAKRDAIYWPIYNLDQKIPIIRRILNIYHLSNW
jgi:type I restriction enzyme M protein